MFFANMISSKKQQMVIKTICCSTLISKNLLRFFIQFYYIITATELYMHLHRFLPDKFLRPLIRLPKSYINIRSGSAIY